MSTDQHHEKKKERERYFDSDCPVVLSQPTPSVRGSSNGLPLTALLHNSNDRFTSEQWESDAEF